MEEPSQLRIISKLNKRVMSDIEGSYSSSIPIRLSELREKQTAILKIPIKINKSKLPPDFFPKTQGKRSSIHRSKYPLRQGSNKISRSLPQKPQSERRHVSPDKTSFFGFFNQQQEFVMAMRNMNSLKPFKRNFQTSQSPKREINQQMAIRKLTPASLSRNSDVLDLLGNKAILNVEYPQIDSPYLKRIKMSPRKQHQSKYLDNQQSFPVQDIISGQLFQGQSPKSPQRNKRNKEGWRQNLVQISRRSDITNGHMNINGNRNANGNLQKQNSQQEANLIFWQGNNNSMNLTFSSNNKSSSLPPINNNKIKNSP